METNQTNEEKNEQYWDGYDTVTGKWLGCVKATDMHEARKKLNLKSEIHQDWIAVTKREVKGD